MKFQYRLTTGDYRTALYFGTAIRLQKSLRAAFLVCIVALGFFAAEYTGTIPPMRYPIYILLGYLLWLCYLLISTERKVLKYIRQKDNLLFKQMNVTLTEEGLFSLKVEGETDILRVPVKNLFYVFENGRMFNIYINEQQTCLLPKRVMQEDEIATARSLFARRLKDRFDTRYGENSQPQKRRSWLFPKR